MGLERAGTRVINAVNCCVLRDLNVTIYTILYTPIVYATKKNRRCTARGVYSTTLLRSVEYEYGPSGGRLEYVEYVLGT